MIPGLVAFAFLLLNLLLVGVAIARLRRPTPLRAAPILAGGLTLVAAAGAYLIVTQPPFNILTAAVVVGVAVLLGAMTGLRPVIWVANVGPIVRRPMPPLAAWGIAYPLGLAVPLALGSPEARAAGALLVLFGAGVSIGSTGALLQKVSSMPTGQPARMLPLDVASSTAPPAAPTPPPQPTPIAPAAALVAPTHITHLGSRFGLGYSAAAFLIWDRYGPPAPIAAFSRTTDGHEAAWRQYLAWEPQPTAAPVTDVASLALVADAEGVAFTHAGMRFVIGRTADGYGIWDRWAPGQPIERFPATDEGAQSAWSTFAAWEPTAVSILAPSGVQLGK